MLPLLGVAVGVTASHGCRNTALAGHLALSVLLLIAVAKVIAPAACIGLGIPVGVIAPTLVIGAACGAILTHLALVISPESAASPDLHVMLGMAAMLAATLRAPLAALVIVLALAPGIILPAMLIVVIATWTTGSVFRQRSVFLTMLAALGLERSPSQLGGVLTPPSTGVHTDRQTSPGDG